MGSDTERILEDTIHLSPEVTLPAYASSFDASMVEWVAAMSVQVWQLPVSSTFEVAVLSHTTSSHAISSAITFEPERHSILSLLHCTSLKLIRPSVEASTVISASGELMAERTSIVPAE